MPSDDPLTLAMIQLNCELMSQLSLESKSDAGLLPTRKMQDVMLADLRLKT